MPKRNLILLLATVAACLAAVAARERDAQGRRFGEVMSIIDRAYLEPVDGDAIFDAAIDAAMSRLDEHSAFVRGEVRRELETALDQRFAGVGLELSIDDSRREPVVVTPVPGSPAWRAGIVAGDRIEAIDGEATAGLQLREVVNVLRGRRGEPVTLRIVSVAAPGGTLDPVATPAASARDVTLVREFVRVESVRGDRRRADGGWNWMVEDEPHVALVRITGFGEQTAAELAAALESIAAEPDLRGLVLDLRGNPGGLLSAAVDVCDLFLEDGVIVVTRGRRNAAAAGDEGVVDVRRATAGATLAGVPIAVLVDGLTASAAEIVAACLQDAGRATIVGSRSFGKGTVQSILPLSDGRGLIKITTSEYLRPSRANIHRRPDDGEGATWGVSPDAGCEIVPTAEAAERVREWRHRRDVVPPREASGAGRAGSSAGLPRDVDAVLARGIEALASH
ncbi:MAG: S41 family peptidase [Planctomycetota bacterium]|nr:MAG: S41 family peptidase [Planctomycetota bacterium]